MRCDVEVEGGASDGVASDGGAIIAAREANEGFAPRGLRVTGMFTMLAPTAPGRLVTRGWRNVLNPSDIQSACRVLPS